MYNKDEPYVDSNNNNDHNVNNMWTTIANITVQLPICSNNRRLSDGSRSISFSFRTMSNE